jgi:hypothetical protein
MMRDFLKKTTGAGRRPHHNNAPNHSTLPASDVYGLRRPGDLVWRRAGRIACLGRLHFDKERSMRSVFWKGLGIAGVVVSLLSSPAPADTVVAKFNTVSPNRIFAYTLDGVTSNGLTYAGEFNWTRTGGDHPGAPDGDFVTFCVELTQHINFNTTYTYNVVPLENAPDPGGYGVTLGMGIEKADMIRELWGRHFADIQDSDTAAAFQVAVWEIVYDDERSMTSGAFRARMPGYDSHANDFVPLAQTWLNSIDGTGPRANIKAISNTGLQDEIFVDNAPSYGEVPSPAAVWGGLAMLGALAAWRYRGRAPLRA